MTGSIPDCASATDAAGLNLIVAADEVSAACALLLLALMLRVVTP